MPAKESKTNLKGSIANFLLEAEALANWMKRHGAPLTRVGVPGIHAKTGVEMRDLSRKIRQVHAERLPRRVGSMTPLVREARGHISAIAAAARFAAERDEQIGIVLQRLRRTSDSVDAIVFALYEHRALLEKYRVLGPLVAPRVVERIPALIEELRAKRPKTLAEARKRQTAERDALVAELAKRVRDVRALAALIYRDQPEILAELAPQRRRARRSKTPSVTMAG